MPILFFTQLMGLAYGMPAKKLGFGREIDLRPAGPGPHRHRGPADRGGGGREGRRSQAQAAQARRSDAAGSHSRERTRRCCDDRPQDRRLRLPLRHQHRRHGRRRGGPRLGRSRSSADKGVVVSRDYPFMCSSLGQELIENDIKEYGLERVVVGACSPHMHEKTFREASSNAGLNPYLAELVSIREQVSWVHTDKAKATEKAKAIIAGGVYRVAEQVPLEPLIAPINNATLVVGGGIAGITAALEIADAGYPVHIVEREPSIGGHMAQYDKTFPTLDCAACILTPKMVDAGAHPNITLHTWSEVEEVYGSVGDFKVRVKHKPRMVVEADCTGCGICWEKCPVQVIDTGFEAGIGYRKAIYTPFPQAVPKYPVLTPDELHLLPEGHLQGLREVLPGRLHRLHPDR